MEIPDVSYARSGDVAIAYQTVGAGPVDLVFLPFLSNLYSLWQFPDFPRFAHGLAAFSRLVIVNTRGMGLSDRPRGLTIEGRMDDVRAVLDDLGIERATLFGIAETSNTCLLFAASYPERVDRLVLYAPYARGSRSDTYPFGSSREERLAEIAHERARWGDRAHLEDFGRMLNPQWADDPAYLEAVVWNHRLSASPETYAEFQRMILDTDITEVLPTVRVPTLVLSKEPLRETCDYVATRIPDSRHVVLPGRGLALFETEDIVGAIESFLGGTTTPDVPDSVLATILFTDLVGSTQQAAALGDRLWRELLERHHAVVRRELARYRGVELDTAGDGFFASFDGPARAIGCAHSIVQTVSTLGLTVRAGIHTGECERVGEKLAGLAVSVGAREW